MRSIDCKSISELFGNEKDLAGDIKDANGRRFPTELVKDHISKCPLCSAKYGLDLVIVEAIRSLPIQQAPGIAPMAVTLARKRITRQQAIRLAVMFAGLIIFGFWVERNIAWILTRLVSLFANSSVEGVVSIVIKNAVANGSALLKAVELILLRPAKQDSIPLINYLIAGMLLYLCLFTVLAMYLFKRFEILGSRVRAKEVNKWQS